MKTLSANKIPEDQAARIAFLHREKAIVFNLPAAICEAHLQRKGTLHGWNGAAAKVG